MQIFTHTTIIAKQTAPDTKKAGVEARGGEEEKKRGEAVKQASPDRSKGGKTDLASGVAAAKTLETQEQSRGDATCKSG